MTTYTYREEALVIENSTKELWQFTAEIVVQLTLETPGRPAQLYGPPEHCYPAEPPEWSIDYICLYVGSVFIELDSFEGEDTLIERAIEAANREGIQDD